jgi:N-acetylglucosaminyldiphosphoundecaprenol N-acetyl-beta-D-mannosaminyltransferase
MIDWPAVGFAALWMVGLGLMLAALSFTHYLAHEEKRRFTQALQRPGLLLMLNLGLSLFCAGWAVSAPSIAESALWGLLALVFGIQTARTSPGRAAANPSVELAPPKTRDFLVRRSGAKMGQGAGLSEDFESVTLLGVRIHTLSAGELIQFITDTVSAGRKACVAYVNTYAINLSIESPWFRDFLNNADVTYCDGFGVKWGARLLGLKIAHRYTPPDWVSQLAVECVRQEVSLFLLGARPGVASRAAIGLQKRFPGLNIVGTHHGYFDKRPDGVENAAVLEEILTAQPDILIVGFGMPLQERWLAENWQQIQAKVAVPAGALIDYLAGEVPRAPRWMTDHGMEWFGRLVIEPRRLWRRYLVGNPQFLWRILMDRLGLGHAR